MVGHISQTVRPTAVPRSRFVLIFCLFVFIGLFGYSVLDAAGEVGPNHFECLLMGVFREFRGSLSNKSVTVMKPPKCIK